MKVAFKSKSEIATAAEQFLKQYHGSDTTPIPIEEIAELQLGITVIPVPSLQTTFGHESFISSDFKHIIMDNAIYVGQPDRTRFTYAHELGHFILHKEIYGENKITSIDEFLKFHNALSSADLKNLHVQANSFAGKVLLPKTHMDELVDGILQAIGGIKNFTHLDLQELVKYVKDKFQVSEACVVTAVSIDYQHLIEAAKKNYVSSV